MKNVYLLLFIAVVLYIGLTGNRANRNVNPTTLPTKTSSSNSLTLYEQINLNAAGLQKAVFDYALRGWRKTDTTKRILTIADMSQPSNRKRLYVIDLSNKKLLYHTYVAHGRNSGDLIPDRFSNTRSSLQSSLGFYRTLSTYMGRHGLSLQLKGLEKGFNDNVYDRNIVLHGADYVCEEVIQKTGRLGWSEGCPAIPYAVSKGIINVVKGGSCLFIYAPNPTYLSRSTYLSLR